MDCKYFGICGSCTKNDPYEKQLTDKANFIKENFSDIYDKEIEIFSSLSKAYRIRSEFKIYHDENIANYAMSGKEKFVIIDECQKVDKNIAILMPKLLKQINQNENLRTKLFGVEFITTKFQTQTTMLYHKDIFLIKNELEKLSKNLNISLIARSRNKKLIFNGENLKDELIIDKRVFSYTISEGSFIQPNKLVNQKMISWAKKCIVNPKDLLEMYCGHGNFTIPISLKFNKVLATEISKKSIENALKNCELNNINNINFIRLDANELIQAFNGAKFNRLKNINLKDFNFSHILVDPPRAGLSDEVCKFGSKFQNIIYISCNPLSLKRDLLMLSKTHKIIKFALFDQFANTNHIECGVLLTLN